MNLQNLGFLVVFVSRNVEGCLRCADATNPTNVGKVAFFCTELLHLQLTFFLKASFKSHEGLD